MKLILIEHKLLHKYQCHTLLTAMHLQRQNPYIKQGVSPALKDLLHDFCYAWSWTTKFLHQLINSSLSILMKCPPKH